MTTPVLRRSRQGELAAMLSLINQAAIAYQGVIPPDCWHEPYMSREALLRDVSDGVTFWVVEEEGRLLGTMGLQDKGEVALVRHAYVAPAAQRKGIGTKLLRQVEGLAAKPVLIGTWAAARWAIDFYRRNGYGLVAAEEKDALLRRYWSIPERQVETSVVLADDEWRRATAGRPEGGAPVRSLS